MTARIAADGAVEGCDVAVLHACPTGLSTYTRLGYRTVVSYPWYFETPPPSPEERPAG
jgi:hypothetical protein